MKKIIYGIIVFLTFGLVVNAETTFPNEVHYYDNNGSSLRYIGTETHCVENSYGCFSPTPINVNGYGGAIIFPLNQTLIKGVNYSISIDLFWLNAYDVSDRYYASPSTKPNVTFCSSTSDCISKYVNGINDVSTSNYIHGTNYGTFYYNFTVNQNGYNYILVPVSYPTALSNVSISLYGYSLVSNGSNLSSDDITNITNQQTTEINNSINSATGNINNNINQVESSINNSIQNTEDNINASINDMGESINSNINENFNQCRESHNLFNINGSYSASPNNISIANDNITMSSLLGGNSSRAIFLQTFSPGTYTFSSDNNFFRFLIVAVSPTITSVNSFGYNATYGGYYSDITTHHVTFTIDKEFRIGFVFTGASGSSATIQKPQLESGTSSSTYEQYGEICENRLDSVNDSINGVNSSINDMNNNITNPNVDSSSANGFFSNFQVNDHGLSSIITAPLRFIQNLVNNQCSPLILPLPFVNKNLSLPCMNTIYSAHFGNFFTLYQTITTGFIAYWVSVRIYALVKGFKDPENDRIEVMDL